MRQAGRGGNPIQPCAGETPPTQQMNSAPPCYFYPVTSLLARVKIWLCCCFDVLVGLLHPASTFVFLTDKSEGGLRPPTPP